MPTLDKLPKGASFRGGRRKWLRVEDQTHSPLRTLKTQEDNPATHLINEAIFHLSLRSRAYSAEKLGEVFQSLILGNFAGIVGCINKLIRAPCLRARGWLAHDFSIANTFERAFRAGF